jgi:hypothetical protein
MNPDEALMRFGLALMCLVVVTLGGCTQAPEAVPAATGQIDGAALDQLVRPHVNASIRLAELDLQTNTNERGGFSFYALPAGYYTLHLDLGEGERDEEIVSVRSASITRIILQTRVAEASSPYATLISDTQTIPLAMPGESCEECTWRTDLRHSSPTSVDLEVTWNPSHPALGEMKTNLVVHLVRDDGTVLLGPLDAEDVVDTGGMAALRATLHVVPADTDRVQVLFAFAETNVAPHPDFRVASTLVLHHGDEEL